MTQLTSNVIGPIVPASTGDEYPTHYDKYGQGGYRIVDTLTERDSIPEPRRRAGMLVKVLENDKTYELTVTGTTGTLGNSSWGNASIGGGTIDYILDWSSGEGWASEDPYIAGSNGENRVLSRNPSGAHPPHGCIYIMLPSTGFVDDQTYQVDGSTHNPLVVFISPDMGWNRCNAKNLYISIDNEPYTNDPVIYNDIQVQGFKIDSYSHYIFEAYPSANAWTCIGHTALLFKSSNGNYDGWGNNAELNSNGMITRYTHSESEYDGHVYTPIVEADMNLFGFGWELTWTPLIIDTFLGGTEYSDRNGNSTHFASFDDYYINFGALEGAGKFGICNIISVVDIIYVCGDDRLPTMLSNWVNTGTITSFALRPMFVPPLGSCNIRIFPPSMPISFVGDNINGYVYLDGTNRFAHDTVNIHVDNVSGQIPTFNITLVGFNSQGNCSKHRFDTVASGLPRRFYLKMNQYDNIKMSLSPWGVDWQPNEGTLITMNGTDGTDGWGNVAELTRDGRYIQRFTLSEDQYLSNIVERKYHNHQSGIEGLPTIIQGDDTTDVKGEGEVLRTDVVYKIVTAVTDFTDPFGANASSNVTGTIFTPMNVIVLVNGDVVIQLNRGKVKIGECECWFYTGEDRDTLFQKDLPQSNDWLTITPDVDNFICAYNNGNKDDIAYWIKTNNVNDIDYVHTIPYFVCFRRNGSKHLHIQIVDLQAHGDVELHHQRVFACDRYNREKGALTGFTVDPSTFNISLSDGYVWSVNHRNYIPATSGVTEHYICTWLGNQWNYYDYYQPHLNTTYYNSTTVRTTGYTTIVNHFYTINNIGDTNWMSYGATNNNIGTTFKCTVSSTLSGLDELFDAFSVVPSDKWTIAYVYRGIEQEDHCYTFFSNTLYNTLELAQASKSMPTIPPLVESHTMSVGRIIFKGQTSDVNEVFCESAFDTVFSTSSNITVHNSLSGRDDLQAHPQYVLVGTPVSSTGTSTLNDVSVSGTIYFNGEESLSGTTNIDWTTGNKKVLTWGVTGTTSTVTFGTPPQGPTNLTLRLVKVTGTGSTLVMPSIKWSGGITNLPTWTTTSNAVDLLNLYYDGTYYYGSALLDMR